MPNNTWESNNGSSTASASSKHDFGHFLTRAVQDTTSHIVSQCRRAGIKVEHSFKDGRGTIQMTGANEKALDVVTLPAKMLDSGVNTAFVSLGCVKVDFISSYGTPITLFAGMNIDTNNDTIGNVSNETIIVATMNMESQKRRRDAYQSNSEYKVIKGSDADVATRSLADLYENDHLDTTGVAKTFSVMIWVYV